MANGRTSDWSLSGRGSNFGGVRRRHDSGQVVHIHIHRAVLTQGRRGPTAGRVTVGSAEVSVVAAAARCALAHRRQLLASC